MRCGLVLALAGMAGRASGAGLRDLADGWLLGPAATDALLGGQAAQGTGGWLLLGQGRLFGLPELPLNAIVGGVRCDHWPGTPSVELGWQALGQGLYREDERQVHLEWGRWVRLGLWARWLSVRTGGTDGVGQEDEVSGQVAATLQGRWQDIAGTHIQVRLRLPVVDSPVQRRRAGRRALLGLQGWRGGVALAVAVDTKPDQTLTLAVEWTLAWGTMALGMRVEPSVGSLGPVLAWRRGRLLVRSSHLVHPQLGVTHRFAVGMGLGRSPW